MELYEVYRAYDFRQHPEKYRVGRGEQGALIAQPYCREIGMHWKFRTPDIARGSSSKIFSMFQEYLDQDDFPGADMARKFLMMGWTRSRRYANHASGKKYDSNRNVLPQEEDNQTSLKAESARIFKAVYEAAKADYRYRALQAAHRLIEKKSRTCKKKISVTRSGIQS